MNPARLLALYEAGDLKRLHALPTVRVHTMAEHVFGAVLMADELMEGNSIRDDVRLSVYRLLMHHDAPEVWTGDVPAHMKKKHASINEALEREEGEWYDEMGIVNAAFYTDDVKQIAKAADRLDLAMTCVRERKYGNRHARNEEVFNRAIAYAEEEAVGVPGVSELVELLRKEWNDDA